MIDLNNEKAYNISSSDFRSKHWIGGEEPNAGDWFLLQEVQEIHADLLRTDQRQDGSGYERHHDKMPYSQMYQSSDP